MYPTKYNYLNDVLKYILMQNIGLGKRCLYNRNYFNLIMLYIHNNINSWLKDYSL